MDDVPLPVAPADKPTTEMALAETPASEVPPVAEVAVIEHVVALRLFSIETSQGKAAESEVNITPSASAGKNFSVLNLAHISLYLLLNLKNFAEALAEIAPPVMSKPEQEKEVTPPVIDPYVGPYSLKSYSTTGHIGRLAGGNN